MSTPLLSVHDLTVTICGKQVCANLNLDIHAGQRWALLGVPLFLYLLNRRGGGL